MFVGRQKELELLEDAYTSPKSELVVIYGRRRIGKSSLVYQFARSHGRSHREGQEKPQFLPFEAIEGENTQNQIRHFTATLRKHTGDPFLDNAHFKNWEQIFTYMTDRVIPEKNGKKTIVFFDELQWMAAGRTKLVSLLKYYWDNHWKNKHVLLILCGSIASFMTRKVLKSNALYGRINLEILLKGLSAHEAALLFGGKRSKEEILKYLMVFGGVPKYLEEINLNRSFNQNMNRLCFSHHGPMVKEVERLFYSQFREVKIYKKIVELLKTGLFSLEEISRKMGFASGGGLKSYLDNLEQAEIIRTFIPFGKGIKSKFKKYTLFDEFLYFYLKYMEPNQRIMEEGNSDRLFETLTQESFDMWLGFAFERFCLRHSSQLAGLMGFRDNILLATPHFGKGDQKFQVDLLYQRSDRVITLCEIKHRNKPVTREIIPEVERKCRLLDIPTGYTLEKALISLYGPDESLKKEAYFHHSITLEDLV
ncbi:MAG: AAA family ATPase [bacterium]|nr:AAA family ATPase [bacterium]